VLAVPVIAILRVILGFQFLGGQVTMIVLLLMLSSFQLFFLFVMGQYVARIYDEVRGRPLYIVASTYGFKDITAVRKNLIVSNELTRAPVTAVSDEERDREVKPELKG